MDFDPTANNRGIIPRAINDLRYKKIVSHLLRLLLVTEYSKDFYGSSLHCLKLGDTSLCTR